MPIRKPIMVAGLVLAIAALCASSALAKAGGTDRPVKGKSSGISIFCPATGELSENNSGVMAHLGKFTGHEEGTVAFTVFPAFEGSGTFGLVAANGDQVTGTWTVTGEATFNPFGHTATIVLTVLDGSGRFADASGTITVQQDGTNLFSADGCSHDLDEETATGQISY
jgi:hypothetical protein